MNNAVLLITAILSFIIPIGLGIFWSIKTKCKIKAYVVGVIIFIVFVNIIESLAHTYFLTINSSTATFLYANPIAYGLYAAIMAGLFEELGRFVGFRILLSKENGKEISVGYGIGHGGIECIMTLGITYALYAIVGLGGTLGDIETDKLILQNIAQIDSSIIPLAIFERIIAIAIHISLSVIVFKAAKEKGNIKLLFLSMFLHFLCDVPAGLFQAGIISSLFVIEALTFVITMVVAIYAYKTYKKMKEEF